MADAKKKPALALLFGSKGDDDGEEPESEDTEDEPDEADEATAEEFADAVKAGDGKEILRLFKTLKAC